jgi:predicted ferric reductase
MIEITSIKNNNGIMKLSLISLTSLLVYLALILSPLAIAISLDLDHRPFLDQLSSGLAILGFNIIFLEFVLSGRIQLLSKTLGVDWVLQIHQLMSRTAAIFLLIHPLLYTLPNAPAFSSFPPSATYLGLTTGTAFTGIVALVALIILIGLAITRHTGHIKYEYWRISHALLAVSIALMGFHHTSHAGRYSQETVMLRYWQIALGVSLLTLIWVYVIRPLIQKSHAYEVVGVRETAHKIYELTIKARNSKILHYQAGQFAWLKLKSTAPLFENPFSFSSAPNISGNENKDHLQFLIKDVGDFTHQVSELKAGDLVYLDGPYGNFGNFGNFGQSTFKQTDGNIVLIAGGAGIAPIISLLRGLAYTKNETLLNKTIRVIYGNRIKEQMVDLASMIDLQDFTNIEIIPVLTESNADWRGVSGLLDQSNLEKILIAKDTDLSDLKDTQFYICGPAVMIDSVESALAGMGVPLSHIESEKFQYDYSKKGVRNRLSLILAGGVSAALVVSAWLAAL